MKCECCGAAAAQANPCPDCKRGRHTPTCKVNRPTEEVKRPPAEVKAADPEPEKVEPPAEPELVDDGDGKENPEPEPAKALVKAEPRAITTGSQGLVLRSLDEVFRFARYIHASGLAPRGLETVEKVFVAVEMGLELGMTPMMSLANIGVVNGKPAPYGAAVKGIVEASGKMSSYREFYEGGPMILEEEGKAPRPNPNFAAVVVTRRADRDQELRTEFSIADAMLAKLWGKMNSNSSPSPWVLYPKRMLLWRARQFNLNDNFPEVTRGFKSVEELRDIEDEAAKPVDPEMPRRLSEKKAEEAPAS